MARFSARGCVLSTALALGFCAPSFAAEAAKPSIALAERTAWQPPGGEFHFTITSPTDSDVAPSACLAWTAPPVAAAAAATPALPNCNVHLTVHRVSASTTTPVVVEYAAAVPDDIDASQAEPYHLQSKDERWNSVGRLLGPAAGYLVVTIGQADAFWVEVGITSRSRAALHTLIAVLLAGFMLLRFANRLDVPGPKEGNALSLVSSVPLRLITGATGWASLSQLQIILWTFVVGGGAIYVMSLTGSLIPISVGTLELLGIAGAASVLAEAKANQQSDPGASMAKPGAVQNLQPLQGNESTELVATWDQPSGSAPIANYIVQYGEGPPATAPTVWKEASRDPRDASLRIVGLAPNTDYWVRVAATNPAGTGDWAQASFKTPAGAMPTPSVANLRANVHAATEKSIPLECDATGDVPGIDIQCRDADSGDAWTDARLKSFKRSRTFDVPKGSNLTHFHEEATGLRSGTRYQFRARQGSLDWSEILTVSTIHVARWADIVTDTDRSDELDVTRVQMLFFTVISALFVALKIVDTSTIPDIPQQYVTLMGISNGVYLTTKFVRR